jgi:charged multivesicular body protein 7
MGELLESILNQGEDFSRSGFSFDSLNPTNDAKRARLPSLYSDFTLQRHTNPDGYAANVAAWERALQKAAKAGLIPTPGDMHDTLSIRTGEDLLRSLETKEWGRPLALERVIVGKRLSSACL